MYSVLWMACTGRKGGGTTEGSAGGWAGRQLVWTLTEQGSRKQQWAG